MGGAGANKRRRGLGRGKMDAPQGQRRTRNDHRGGGDKFITTRRGKRQDASLPEMLVGAVAVFSGVEGGENLGERKNHDPSDQRHA